MQARLSGERHVIERDSPLYPALLRDLDGAPDEIYVLGNPEALARESVSIIGARRATPYGIACAQLAARVAAEFDLQVVSGAAIGCDQAAQREALARGACSVAVLGGGANVVYPSNAEDLLRDILATDGALLSLSRWDAPPLRHTFVRRNPVIAALSRALVICEAGVPSGTFSTAEAAERIGRSVLVFPGVVLLAQLARVELPARLQPHLHAAVGRGQPAHGDVHDLRAARLRLAAGREGDR
jgi:DNA processing protein